MRELLFGLMGLITVVALQAQVLAHDAKNLPAGPIRDRHELMEGIGKNAKAIGNALKSGDLKAVPDAAEAIHTDAAKILPLFPPGSTHAESRAKPEIWTDWKTFEASAKDLEKTAGDLAAAAKSGGDVAAAADKMFDNCKGCHEKFRVPDKK